MKGTLLAQLVNKQKHWSLGIESLYKYPGQVLDTVEGTDRKEGVPSKSTMQVSPKSQVPSQHRELCHFQKKRGNTWKKKTELFGEKLLFGMIVPPLCLILLLVQLWKKNRHNRRELNQPLPPWRTSVFSGVFCLFVVLFVLFFFFFAVVSVCFYQSDCLLLSCLNFFPILI